MNEIYSEFIAKQTMWPVSVWQLSVGGAVTVLVLLLGFIYTYVRQKGIKSLSAVPATTDAPATDKWPTGQLPVPYVLYLMFS